MWTVDMIKKEKMKGGEDTEDEVSIRYGSKSLKGFFIVSSFLSFSISFLGGTSLA